MDRTRNPYTPNAGAQPPFLAGRRVQLEDFGILLQRLALGRPERALVVTGLRGVGKTVLLREYEQIANSYGWTAVTGEVSKNTSFETQLAMLARKALFQVSPKAKWGAKAKRAAAVIKSFSLSVQPDGSLTAGLDVDPAFGAADTGQLIDDLPDVFEAIGEAARERGSGVVFLFDEIQFLSAMELEALLAAVHRAVHRRLPVTFSGAGLPQVPGLAGDAKSYAERLLRYVSIQELAKDDALRAVAQPAEDESVPFDAAAAEAVYHYSQGYPYFIQEYGRAAWNVAPGPGISLEDVEAARVEVEAELDESYFRTRVQRSTKEELRYMRAMAELGAEEQKAAEVAEVLGKTSEQVAPLRARLINKGLLFTPRFGFAKFTVPQFDVFMKRYMDLDGEN
ncbi:ATPase [Frondihabitans sp. PAMC 28766]|uniref:ATP-binding protein n=1 Tax=Frondihabitans sp. PAMC 28766 TaxID=1795630 RepID=UPI00078EC03F|nr:ATP-binding protein [Frondihabitans sp. PAMC 28766]AMM19856.1 ATPase [Frondihabitans sp. PAMC 28766]